MSDFTDALRDLALPTASQFYRAASTVDSARKEYDSAYAALQQYEDRQETEDRDAVWDELARQGKLTANTAAKALGQIRAAKTNRMAAAQMQAQMYRAAARQRQAELGQMAKSATVSDIVGLGTKAVGLGLGIAGAGAASPVMAGIGESLSGIGGGTFTAEATRKRYPDLYKNPWQTLAARQAQTANPGYLAGLMPQQYAGSELPNVPRNPLLPPLSEEYPYLDPREIAWRGR